MRTTTARRAVGWATLAELYATLRPRLVRYAAARVGPDRAEDAVQLAAESLLRGRDLPDLGERHLVRAVSCAAMHLNRDAWLHARRLVRAAGRCEDGALAWSLEDAVVTRAVLRGFVLALPPAERRSLLIVAFGPGRATKTRSDTASRARRRLRALRAEEGA